MRLKIALLTLFMKSYNYFENMIRLKCALIQFIGTQKKNEFVNQPYPIKISKSKVFMVLVLESYFL